MCSAFVRSQTKETMDNAWRLLVWSSKSLASGRWPTHDAWERAYHPLSREGLRAGFWLAQWYRDCVHSYTRTRLFHKVPPLESLHQSTAMLTFLGHQDKRKNHRAEKTFGLHAARVWPGSGSRKGGKIHTQTYIVFLAFLVHPSGVCASAGFASSMQELTSTHTRRSCGCFATDSWKAFGTVQIQD